MTHTLDVACLVREYQAGRSVAALAREAGVDSSAVRSRLVAAGVAIRGAREATSVNLARDPSIVERMGRPAVHTVRSGFFDTLTPESAYVIGLMQADGANQTDRGVVTITLKRSDQPLLEALSSLYGGGRPIRYDSTGQPRLMVQNRGLSDGLARWGVVSPKTHTASTHPALLADRDYWRGVIDGDGSLCRAADGRRILSLVGSEPICGQFLAFCCAHGAGLRRTVRPHRSIYSVHLSDADSVKMAQVLYRDAALALERKARTAEAWENAA